MTVTDPTPSAHCACHGACHCAVSVAQATSAPVESPTPSAPAAALVATPRMPNPWGIGLRGNPSPPAAPARWSAPVEVPLFIRYPVRDEVRIERARVRACQLERLIVVNRLYNEHDVKWTISTSEWRVVLELYRERHLLRLELFSEHM
jgi:hypothetical protein